MANNKDWATKMLELDLKGQEGSIWTTEKSKDKSKKPKQYKIKDDKPLIMKPDPIYYGKKKIENNPEILN